MASRSPRLESTLLHCEQSSEDLSKAFKIPESFFVKQEAIEIDTSQDSFGHGAYAKVIRVFYHGAVCRAKRIHAVLVNDTSINSSRFIQECRIASTLKHPNVVQYFGMCMDGKIPMLIMEELEGSLYDLLHCDEDQKFQSFRNMPYAIMVPSEAVTVPQNMDKGEQVSEDSEALTLKPKTKIPNQVKIQLALDMVQGLTYLHNKSPYPVVHRDLSSSNVLVCSNMHAKLVDFGQAKELRKEGQLSSLAPGTLQYLAPELRTTSVRDPEALHSGLVLDPSLAEDGRPALLQTAIDMYSYGILVTEIATQELPANDYQTTLTKLEELGGSCILAQVARSVLKFKPEERNEAKAVLDTLKQVMKPKQEMEIENKAMQDIAEDRETDSDGFFLVAKLNFSGGKPQTGLKAKLKAWIEPTRERLQEVQDNLRSVS